MTHIKSFVIILNMKYVQSSLRNVKNATIEGTGSEREARLWETLASTPKTKVRSLERKVLMKKKVSHFDN